MTSIPTSSNPLTSSVGLKIGSVIGLIVFSGFYVNSWQKSLSNYYAQQQEQQAETVISETATPLTVAEVAPATIETPTATQITDPNLINNLSTQLYRQIDQNWQQYPTFTENLVYRISVNETGAIGQYSTINPAAAEYIHQTPIPKLIQTGTDSQPQAEFLVVMAPSGTLQVNPWVSE